MTLRWLIEEDAKKKIKMEKGTEAQLISFVVNLPALYAELLEIPHVLSDPEGMPTYLWYGEINSRIFSLECLIDVNDANRWSPIIQTLYVDRNILEDWQVLLEFSELPACIFPMRPLRVSSRATTRKNVVFRPHPKGWNEPVYYAESLEEAERFLDYLRKDAWNEDCFIGEGESDGYWVIIEENAESKQVGGYPDFMAAVRTAWEFSSRCKVPARFVVRDLQDGGSKWEYEVDSSKMKIEKRIRS